MMNAFRSRLQVYPRWVLVMVLSGANLAVPAEPAKLLSVRIVPSKIDLWSASPSQTFLLLAKYADGLERDITSESRIRISDNAVARIGDVGEIACVGTGSTRLVGEFGGRSAEAAVVVEDCR